MDEEPGFHGVHNFMMLALLEPASSASCFVKAKRCLNSVVPAQETATGSLHMSNRAVQQEQISKGTRMVLRTQCPHCAQGRMEVKHLQSLKRMTTAFTGSGTSLFIFPTNVIKRVQTLLLLERGPGMQAETPAKQLPLLHCWVCDNLLILQHLRAHKGMRQCPYCSGEKSPPEPAPPVTCGFPHPTFTRHCSGKGFH